MLYGKAIRIDGRLYCLDSESPPNLTVVDHGGEEKSTVPNMWRSGGEPWHMWSFDSVQVLEGIENRGSGGVDLYRIRL